MSELHPEKWPTDIDCEHCDQKATNFIWDGSFCDDCLEGLAEDYYAFSPGDSPNE